MMIWTLFASRFAIRSLIAGVGINVHFAPVALWTSKPVRLSIAVTEPPACLSAIGSLFAAATKSFMFLYGESERTTAIVGSSTRRTTGVRSLTEYFASLLVSGVAIQVLVNTAIV